MSSFERLRTNTLPILTKTAHVTAPFITIFLLIHLAAPASATVGGSSLSTQTMLLGREYYQSRLTEPLLILGPLAVHSLSGTFKRLLSPPGKPPRPLKRLLSLTGYASMLFLLPIHFLVHRVAPTNELPPIDALGPSELDYEFVKAGLHTWPIRSWLLYGGLILSVTAHMADGVGIILSSWSVPKLPSRLTRTVTILATVALPTLLGLYSLSTEPSIVFSSMQSRFKAVFMMSTIYNL
ncbi:hypothetical protein CPB83DRAFT_873589 [Crepidotus variabilis]|uniref:Mitochondrial adapter protein MCP1 transmembrane domain-containing protein n=1 Tax=Crepidotus variabilis TaxID=179855 RepID=A0A9P6ERK3_9AGAR|nr:hypothetical protein CPB83DRAFT_873589 [Crepidotus variabilis]